MTHGQEGSGPSSSSETKERTTVPEESNVFDGVQRKFVEAMEHLAQKKAEVLDSGKIESNVKRSQDEAAGLIAKRIVEEENGKVALLLDYEHTINEPGNPLSPRTVQALLTIVDKGGVVAIVTGTNSERIVKDLENMERGGEALLDKVHIFSAYGIMYEGSFTNKKKILTNPQAKKYIEAGEELKRDTEHGIHNSEVLNGLRSRGIIPEDIEVTFRLVAGSVLRDKFVKNMKEQVEEIAKNDSTINVEETVEAACQEVRGIILKVLSNNTYFEVEEDITSKTAIFFKLKPEVPLVISKGNAVAMLAGYGAGRFFTIGDDPKDVEMAIAAGLLAQEDDHHAFVGVTRSSPNPNRKDRREEVQKAATLMVDGPEGLANFLAEIVQQIELKESPQVSTNG